MSMQLNHLCTYVSLVAFDDALLTYVPDCSSWGDACCEDAFSERSIDIRGGAIRVALVKLQRR